MPAPRRSRGERVPEGAEGRLAARRAVRCQAAVYGYQGCLRPHPHSAARGLGVMHMKRATQLIMAGAGTGIILHTSRQRCAGLDRYTGPGASGRSQSFVLQAAGAARRAWLTRITRSRMRLPLSLPTASAGLISLAIST